MHPYGCIFNERAISSQKRYTKPGLEDLFILRFWLDIVSSVKK